MGRVSNNLWLLTRCRDAGTFRTMKGRARRAGGLDRLRRRGVPQPVLYRPGSTDVRVVWEVLREREYDVAGRWPFRTIVDCGANVGVFFLFVPARAGSQLERYVGVEPDEESFAVLRQQVEASALRGRCRLINAAVWSCGGRVPFDATGRAGRAA